MAEKLQIYRCAVCGNIVEVLHGGDGQLVCCGKPMEKLAAKTADVGKEKRVPEKEPAGRIRMVKPDGRVVGEHDLSSSGISGLAERAAMQDNGVLPSRACRKSRLQAKPSEKPGGKDAGAKSAEATGTRPRRKRPLQCAGSPCNSAMDTTGRAYTTWCARLGSGR